MSGKLRAVVVRTWDDIWGGIKAVHETAPALLPLVVILVLATTL